MVRPLRAPVPAPALSHLSLAHPPPCRWAPPTGLRPPSHERLCSCPSWCASLSHRGRYCPSRHTCPACCRAPGARRTLCSAGGSGGLSGPAQAGAVCQKQEAGQYGQHAGRPSPLLPQTQQPHPPSLHQLGGVEVSFSGPKRTSKGVHCKGVRVYIEKRAVLLYVMYVCVSLCLCLLCTVLCLR